MIKGLWWLFLKLPRVIGPLRTFFAFVWCVVGPWHKWGARHDGYFRCECQIRWCERCGVGKDEGCKGHTNGFHWWFVKWRPGVKAYEPPPSINPFT